MSLLEEQIKGGAGSGNFGHSGRPGERGGSGEGAATPVGNRQFEEVVGDYSEWAKENVSFDRTLSKDEIQSLKRYKNEIHDKIKNVFVSEEINKQLLRGNSFERYSDLVKNLDSAIGASTISTDVVLWRGLSSKTDEFEEYLKEGTEVTHRSFLSTGLNQAVVQRKFGTAPDVLTDKGWQKGNAVLLRLEIPSGTHGLPTNLKKFGSTFKDEGEILLQRNTTFRVSNVNHRGFGLSPVVTLRLVDKGSKKSLKAVDSTKKERFDEFLDRAEDEGFLDGDQIDELRDRFDNGDVNDDDIPLALDDAIDDDLEDDDVEESRTRLGLAILGAALLARAVMRDKLQTEFEDKVMQLATDESSIPRWQSQFRDEIARNVIDQSTLGRGSIEADESAYRASMREVVAVIQEQQAYLSRFADERASRALTGDEMTDMYIAARSALYSGAGRAEWFKADLDRAAEGDVVYYRAVGDANTCTPCQDAEDNSPYLPDDPDLPLPGDVCEGHGYCRCDLEIINDAEMCRLLNGEEKSFYKGGAGSGNFGHSGRPGERGGSSSDDASHESKELTQDERDAVREQQNSLYDSKFGGYTVANTYLREGKVLYEQSQDALDEHVRNLDAAFDKSPADRDMTLYRGVNHTEGMNLKVGETFTDKGYVSTSTNKAVGKQFAEKLNYWQKPATFEIRVPKGYPAIDVAKVTGFKAGLGRPEKEVLLPRSTTFKVLSKRGDKYVLEVVPKDKEVKSSIRFLSLDDESMNFKGGAGSGNFNHEGRPGERGGSGSGGSERGKDGIYRDATGKAVNKSDQERLTALKLPPAWKDVKLSSDPHASLQATGRDAKGRVQYVYSVEHSERMAAEKFERLKDFNKELPQLRQRITSDLDSPTADQRTREAAAALYLIDRTGFRVGSDRETGADKQAYGASTLRTEHVKVDGDRVTFSFTGKKGVSIEKTVEDGRLARMIDSRAKQGGRLFNTTDSQVRDYLHSIDGSFKVKDFRTHTANAVALREIAKHPTPRNEKEFAKMQLDVSKVVSRVLGNTPTVAKASYIDPAVWGRAYRVPK